MHRVLACLRPLAATALLITSITAAVAVTDSVAGAATASRPAPPSITMICAPGQFDVNSRDLAAIARALATTTDVAKRIVALGPWWQPSDLLTVQGIGPGKLQTLISANSLCAQLPSTPPPATAPCAGTKTDLNTASAADLRRAFGLNSRAANAMVAARPYLSLAQATPERVPGLGTSSQTLVVRNGCLTPPTITTPSTVWRWAYADTPTTNQRGKFALTVPAGTISGSVGAWLSVADPRESTQPLVGPAADFHIWNDWSDGTKSVTVTLPTAATLNSDEASAWTPAVVHYGANGDEIAMKGAVNLDATSGTISTNLTSLSTVQATRLPSRSQPNTWQAAVTSRTWVNNAIRWYTGIRGDQPTCSPNGETDPNVSLSGSMFAFNLGTGDFPFKWCLQQGGPGQSILKIVNNTAAVYRVDLGWHNSPGSQVGTVQSFLPTDDQLTDQMFSLINDGLPMGETTETGSKTVVFIPPGGGAQLQIPAASDAGLTATKEDHLSNWAQLFRHASDAIPVGKVKTIATALYGCGANGAYSGSKAGAVWACAKTALGGALGVLPDALGSFVTWGPEAAYQASDLIIIGSLSGRWIFKSTVVNPPPGGGLDSCTGTNLCDGTLAGKSNVGLLWRLRIGNQAADTVYLVNADGSASGVSRTLDPSRFFCITHKYPMRDFAPFGEIPWSSEHAEPAACDPSAGPTRLPTTARNWILRDTNGHSFFVDPNGQLQNIQDGFQYITCAQTYLVMYNYPYVEDFGDPTAASLPRATCG